MQPEDCATSCSDDSIALPEWMSLAEYGYPDLSYKVDDVRTYRGDLESRSVKILTTPGSKGTSPAEGRPPMTKQLLEAMIPNLNKDFRSDLQTDERWRRFNDSPGFDEDEFKAILHSRAGGAHHSRIRRKISGDTISQDTIVIEKIESMASLIFVSPNDDWPYVCFAATCAETGYQAVLTTEKTTTGSRKDYDRHDFAIMLVHASEDRIDMDDMGPAIGLEYVSNHINHTLDKLVHLVSIVESVERLVQEVTDNMILTDPIKQLHLCNVQHVMLQRRWAFQKQLMLRVDEILSSGTHTRLLGIPEHRDLAILKKEMSYRTRLVQAAETDLAVLPRRIENQFTALYNLSNQRDAKASVKIAQESAQIAKESARIAQATLNDSSSMKTIAQATLNDSSSMKTIAVMTLIFLPATFACSFFSMTFFNWQTESNRTVSTYLWVYFAVTVPVTTLVLAAWALLTKKNRQENSARVGISQLMRRKTLDRGHDLEKND